MTTTQHNIDIAQQLLLEFGLATAGDYSDLNGDLLETDLQTISAVLSTKEPADLTALRAQLDLCPQGLGHWTEHCNGC